MTPDGDLINLRGAPLGMIPFELLYAIATPEGDLIILDTDLSSDTGGTNALLGLVFCVPRVEMVDGAFPVSRSIAGVFTRPNILSPFLKRPFLTNPYSSALPRAANPNKPAKEVLSKTLTKVIAQQKPKHEYNTREVKERGGKGANTSK